MSTQRVPARALRLATASALVAVTLGPLTTPAPAVAAATATDTVWGWGRNLNGQLGEGSAGNRTVPIRVLTGMAALGVGDQQSLTVDASGRAWSFGSNGDGQLGDGTEDDRGVPQLMTGLGTAGTIADVDGGTDHSIILASDGVVRGVGRNNSGQLGTDDFAKSLEPKVTLGLPGGIRAVSAGGNHNLALDGNGIVWAWGSNGVGQLGVTDVTERTRAAEVPGLPQVVEISAAVDGSSNAVLDTAGRVWMWGANFAGELGDGTTTHRAAPAVVPLSESIVDVSAGDGFTVALGASGTLYSWGNNFSGQLGDGTTTQRLTPVIVPMPGVQLRHVAAGGSFAVALDAAGDVWAWGDNGQGYLGDGTITHRPTPGRVIGLPEIVELDAGHGHSLALDAEGGVWAWGRNNNGQLGDHSVRQLSSATRTRPMTPAASLSAGDEHALAITDDGALWAWGGNSHGQLGDGTLITRGTPQPVPGLTDVEAAAAGGRHSLAIVHGAVLQWGETPVGAAGSVIRVDQQSPGPVVGLPAGTNATQVAAGEAFSAALLADGTVWTWGGNQEGQLGDGTSVGRSNAAPVPGLTGVVSLSSDYGHTLALKADGTVWAWGRNLEGQVDPSGITRRLPVPVVGLPPVVEISAGAGHSLARTADGAVWAWGVDNQGELGIAPGGVFRNPPTHVPGLVDVTAVAAGAGHSLVLLASGAVLSFGLNSQGQLGDGTYASSFVPRQVHGMTDAVAIAAGAAFSLAVAGPERRTEATADPGGTVTSDPDGYGATRSDPLQTSVTTPTGGVVVLKEQDAPTPPAGFALLGKQVEITAPPASVGDPLVVAFEVDASIVPVGETAASLQVLRDNVAAAACSGAVTAAPDPCVAERATLATGNIRLTVRTSHASLWNVAVRTAPANVAPTVDTATVNAVLVPVRTAVSASAVFLDPDLSDNHFATWDWGDGTVCVTGRDAGCALSHSPGGGSTTASHAYAAPGTYPVSVTVRDAAGADSTTVAGVVEVHALPTDAAQCKNGGWVGFHFRNQGQCVSWVSSSARAAMTG